MFGFGLRENNERIIITKGSNQTTTVIQSPYGIETRIRPKPIQLNMSPEVVLNPKDMHNLSSLTRNEGSNRSQDDSELFYTGKIEKLEKGEWIEMKIDLTYSMVGNVPIKMINKIKAKTELNPNYRRIIKIVYQAQDIYIAISQQEHREWFCRLVWARMTFMNKHCDAFAEFKNTVKGIIWKKTDILGDWEERFVVISQHTGLESFRTHNLSSPTMTIGKTGELWTRFDVIQGGSFFVIKLKHFGFKIEFGIPTKNCILWLKAFYSLLKN